MTLAEVIEKFRLAYNDDRIIRAQRRLWADKTLEKRRKAEDGISLLERYIMPVFPINTYSRKQDMRLICYYRDTRGATEIASSLDSEDAVADDWFIV